MKRRSSIDLKFSNHKRNLLELFLRIIWNITSFIFFYFPGRYFSILRVYILRIFGARIGERVLINSKVEIYCPWNLEIGERSVLGRNVRIHNFAKVKIGNHCVISQWSYICCSTHNYKGNMELISKDINIKDYSWIAADCFIHGGSIINKGTVIGTKGNFRGESNEWSIYEGNPSIFIKKRELNDI